MCRGQNGMLEIRIWKCLALATNSVLAEKILFYPKFSACCSLVYSQSKDDDVVVLVTTSDSHAWNKYRRDGGEKASYVFPFTLEQDIVVLFSRAVFLQLFYSIAPFALSTRRFRPLSLVKQVQGSIFKEFF